MGFIDCKKCFQEPKQFLRLMAVILCACVASYQLSGCVQKILHPPVNTYYGFNLNKSMKFPSITVCRNPPYKTSELSKYNISRPVTYTNSWINFDFKKHSLEEVFDAITFRQRDFIALYGFAGVGSNVENKSFFSLVQGRCFTFTPKNATYKWSSNVQYSFILSHTDNERRNLSVTEELCRRASIQTTSTNTSTSKERRNESVRQELCAPDNVQASTTTVMPSNVEKMERGIRNGSMVAEKNGSFIDEGSVGVEGSVGEEGSGGEEGSVGEVASVGKEGSVEERSVREGSVREGSVGEGSVGEGSGGEGSVEEGSVGERSVGEGSVGEGSVREERLGEERNVRKIRSVRKERNVKKQRSVRKARSVNGGSMDEESSMREENVGEGKTVKEGSLEEEKTVKEGSLEEEKADIKASVPVEGNMRGVCGSINAAGQIIATPRTETTPSGFNIYIHSASEMLADASYQDDSFMEYIQIETGEQIQINLRPHEYSQIPSKDNPCQDSHNYAKSRCRETCIQKEITTKVGCKTPWLPNDKLPECSTYAAIKEIMTLYRNQNYDSCNCPRSCNITINKPYIQNRQDIAMPYSKVVIYFASNLVTSMNEFIAYDWNIFLADLGGSLGFLLGLSVLGVIGVLEKIIKLLVKCMCKDYGKDGDNLDNDNKYDDKENEYDDKSNKDGNANKFMEEVFENKTFGSNGGYFNESKFKEAEASKNNKSIELMSNCDFYASQNKDYILNNY